MLRISGTFVPRMRRCSQYLYTFFAYYVIIACVRSVLADIEPQPAEADVDFHDIKSDELDGTNGAKTSIVKDVGFVHAFIASFSVIIVSELGDKTFFIAAIMAMKHPRITVFSGAIFALGLMTVLSALFGTLAQLIPRVYTYYISTALFAIFGLKMLKEGYNMKDSDAQEELEEVQSDLKKREDQLYSADNGQDVSKKELMIVDNGIENSLRSCSSVSSLNSMNNVDGVVVANGSIPVTHKQGIKRQKITRNGNVTKSEDIELQNIDAENISPSQEERLEMEVRSDLLSSTTDPESGVTVRSKPSPSTIMLRIFMQAFTMTFLAEWGDRSQLTTIILSARENVYGVIIGGIIGHAICTGLAVIGGRMIAQRISVRTVTIIGGVVFLVFAVSALFFDPNEDSPPDNL